jgi:phosphoserine phosphatase
MKKVPYSDIKPEISKPYTTIYLIRHANPDYSWQEKLGDKLMPLSKEGIKQAKLLANNLKNREIEVIYASELKRAKETANIFAKKMKKRVIINKRLNEINWKNWHRIKYFNTCEARRSSKLKDYQELDSKLDRMQAKGRRLLWDIFRKNKSKRVALFCHGNLIKSIVTSILNADVIGFLSLEIFQSSITKLIIDKNGYVKINHINEISHLPKPPSEDLFITLLYE